jgi:hypothetical protein
MGTNYYIIKNYCSHCNRGDHVNHLGKQSLGWKFLFQSDNDINSFNEWISIIKKHGYKIQDEYKQIIDLPDFISMVNKNQDGLSSCEYNGEKYTGSKEMWEMIKKDTFKDDLGYDFNKDDFR